MNVVCKDFPPLPVCGFGPFRPASGEREDDFPSNFAGSEGKKQNSAEFRGKVKPSLSCCWVGSVKKQAELCSRIEKRAPHPRVKMNKRG